MRIKTKGAERVIARFSRNASPQKIERIGKAVFAAAQLHTATAQKLITQGSISGKGHVPSKPGEPPNRDTGVLDNNIEAARAGQLKATSSSNAPYAAALEFGTSKIDARPYMGPATQLTRDRTAALLAKAGATV